jgi:hypothetical protein
MPTSLQTIATLQIIPLFDIQAAIELAVSGFSMRQPLMNAP